MFGSHFDELLRLAKLARDVGLDQSEWFVNGLASLSKRWNGFLYEKMLQRCMESNRQPFLNTAFRVPVTKDELAAVDGKYKIGTIANTDIQFGLTPLQLQMHGVFAGQSGFGKSTLVKVLCQQILQEGKVFAWVLDPKGEGGDFRFLASEFENIVILRPEVLKCNPFGDIPNVPLPFLKEAISEITADAWNVFDAGEGVILRHVDETTKKPLPNAVDFINSIRREKNSNYGRRASYLETIETRLTKAEISLDEIINCREDYIPKLFDRNVVFEIGELSDSAQGVLAAWILMKLVLFKIKNPSKGLSHLLLFDEGQSQFWARHLELRGRTSFMAKLATQARAFGLGIVVLAQNPMMKLMREITANATIKLSFQLGSSEEMIGFGRTMGLTDAQIEELHHFQPGEAVCRVSLGYTHPMHLELFNVNDEPVSNEELERLMRPTWDMLLDGIKPVVKNESTGSQPNDKSSVKDEKNKPINRKVDDELVGSIPKGMETKEALSSNEKAYLRILSTHPWRLINEVYYILNDSSIMGSEHTISQATAVKTRQKLIKTGYIMTINISGTGRSGKSQCDVPTDKANLDKIYKPRGDWVHGFWAYRIGEFFRLKGANVNIGDTLGGNEVDIDVTIEDKRVGVEIVISGLVVENISKFLSREYFDEMLILCINDKKRKEIEKSIGDLDDDMKCSVSVGLFKDCFVSL